MNKRALVCALIYCALVIAFKLYIIEAGYANGRFGFYFSHIITVFCIVPFFIIAILGARKDNGGIISGKDAMRVGLTVLAVSALVLSIYNYTESRIYAKDLATEYYNSPTALEGLKKDKKFTPAQYPKAISDAITAAENGAFQSTTAKLFPLMLIGVCGSFITALVLKRSINKNS